MFIQVEIQNIKKNEAIRFVVQNNEDSKRIAALYLDAPKGAIKNKLREYVATDVALDANQMAHAFGWSAAFINQSKNFQRTGNIRVAWQFFDTQEELALEQAQHASKMESLGVKKLFAETV